MLVLRNFFLFIKSLTENQQSLALWNYIRDSEVGNFNFNLLITNMK